MAWKSHWNPGMRAATKDQLIEDIGDLRDQLRNFADKVAKITWWSTNDYPNGVPDLPAKDRAALLEIAREILSP